MKNQIFIAKTGLRKKYVSLKRMQNQYIEQLEQNKDLIDLNPKYKDFQPFNTARIQIQTSIENKEDQQGGDSISEQMKFS